MKIFSVSELTQEIKRDLEKRGTFCVRGEVINLKMQSSGHLYFTLKDMDAQVSAVLFKGASKGMTKLPQEGNQIVVQGELTVYAPRGSYQIVVRAIQFQGEGELLAKLHERKKQMQALGYFDASRKKKLPLFPKTIGVVTSPTGAVIQDIVQILERRHSGFHLILFPVKVQGEGAKEEIAKAIDEFNRYQLADVLIVGRGGGSLEDLWAFNEEEVVQAILRSKIPIVSAVGHETDFSLSDFAADVRAPTPSAAAELVLREKDQQLKFLLNSQKQIERQITSTLRHLRNQIENKIKNPYLKSPYLLLARRFQEMDEIKQKFVSYSRFLLQSKKAALLSIEKQTKLLQPSYQIRIWKEKFCSLQKSIDGTISQKIRRDVVKFDESGKRKKLLLLLQYCLEKKKENFRHVISHLRAIDPKNLLTKGYCILFSENNNSVILSSKELAPSQTLKVRLHDGQVKVKVEEITPQ